MTSHAELFTFTVVHMIGSIVDTDTGARTLRFTHLVGTTRSDFMVGSTTRGIGLLSIRGVGAAHHGSDTMVATSHLIQVIRARRSGLPIS